MIKSGSMNKYNIFLKLIRCVSTQYMFMRKQCCSQCVANFNKFLEYTKDTRLENS